MACAEESSEEDHDWTAHLRVRPGSGCSKLTMSLVNVSLKFQVKISNVNI